MRGDGGAGGVVKCSRCPTQLREELIQQFKRSEKEKLEKQAKRKRVEALEAAASTQERTGASGGKAPDATAGAAALQLAVQHARCLPCR